MIDLNYIASRFEYFNRLCFEGSLSTPPFRINRARKTLGKIVFKKQRTLTGRWRYSQLEFVMSGVGVAGLPTEEVDDIILHEMIHYYILSNQMQDTSAHGALFRREMQRINKQYARHITISRKEDRISEECEISHERQSLVAVIHFRDGILGVMTVAQTRLFQLWDFLDNAPSVAFADWYVSQNPFFGRMPRRTTPRYCVVEAETLEKELQNAARLERVGGTIRKVADGRYK